MPKEPFRTLVDKPLVLQTNKISYVIEGGTLLSKFLGEPDASSYPSQMWIASTVTSSIGGATEGLSRLGTDDGALFLKDLLDGDPEAFLGKAHVRTWGSNPAFLVKLLNSRDRLLVQVHPDKERARKYFHSGFGKTEAWHVLDAETGACVHAGFKTHVTKEMLRGAILGEDSVTILSLLNEFPVKKGDVLFIPAGLPHALGKNSLILEIQEPTDITLRAERKRPSGELLPETYLHSGKGMEVLLDCFDYATPDYETARNRIFVKPEVMDRGSGVTELSLIGSGTTDLFSMNRIHLPPASSYERRNDRFAEILVVSGNGFIETGTWSIAVRQGEEIFIPNGVSSYRYSTGTGMELVECFPPKEGSIWQ